MANAQAQAIAPQAAQKIADDARAASVQAPADVPMAGQAVFKLPAGPSFVPQPQAARLLNAMGNPGQDDQVQGLVFAQSDDADSNRFMTVRFENAGSIKDDDARDWNADDLLTRYREGTEAGNDERQTMGVPLLEILGRGRCTTPARTGWCGPCRRATRARRPTSRKGSTTTPTCWAVRVTLP